MHNLYTMWLYALRFVTCKICADAFNLLFSLITCKIDFFLYLVPLLLNRNGNLLAYVAALFVTSRNCRL